MKRQLFSDYVFKKITFAGATVYVKRGKQKRLFYNAFKHGNS